MTGFIVLGSIAACLFGVGLLFPKSPAAGSLPTPLARRIARVVHPPDDADAGERLAAVSPRED